MHILERNIQEVRPQDLSLNAYGGRERRAGVRLVTFAAVNFELMHFLPWEFSFERIILFFMFPEGSVTQVFVQAPNIQ